MGIFFVRSIHAGMGVGLKFFYCFFIFLCWRVNWTCCMLDHSVPMRMSNVYSSLQPLLQFLVRHSRHTTFALSDTSTLFFKEKKATGVHEVSFHTFFFFLVLVRSGMGWAGPPSSSLFSSVIHSSPPYFPTCSTFVLLVIGFSQSRRVNGACQISVSCLIFPFSCRVQVWAGSISSFISFYEPKWSTLWPTHGISPFKRRKNESVPLATAMVGWLRNDAQGIKRNE